MTEALVSTLWERASQGKPSVIVGLPPTLEIPDGMELLRVNCAFPWTAEGPLHKVYRQVQIALGSGDVARRDPAIRDGELRYQLLGEMPLLLVERGFAAACNRLNKTTEGHTVVLFEAAEHADEAVQTSLLHLLEDPDTLELPWILAFHHPPSSTALLDTLRKVYPEDCFLDAYQDSKPLPNAFDWNVLPQEALRILRAGSVIGSVFESYLVSQLLGLEHSEVLEGLQLAADHGAPLGDYGDNRFFLPPEGVEALQQQMLPSLLGFWHEALASLLALPPEPKTKQVSSSIAYAYETPEADLVDAGEEAAIGTDTGSIDSSKATLTEPMETLSLSELLEPHEDEKAPAPLDMTQPSLGEPTSALDWVGPSPLLTPSPSPLSVQEEDPHSALQQDRLRAASHLQSAGRYHDALLMFLEAAQDATATGNTRLGVFSTQQAIAMLSKLPRSRQRTLLEAHILVEMARLKWHGTVSDNTFTLQDAMETLETAKSMLPSDTPPELQGRWAATYAGISHDLGELSMVKQALDELTQVSRKLLKLNKPVEAARLLNDQAALYIRLGDSLRASRQLYESRELFEKILRNDREDSVAMEELAHTEHLLARLPLHARVFQEREEEAFSLALEHTAHAEKLFDKLGMRREQARVWTTQGKLEMGRKQHQAAEEAFLRAIQLQQAIGDWTGLARVCAALSDLFVERGQVIEALGLLGESTVLNLEKGAPIGVAFNRRALEQLKHVLEEQDAHLLPGVREQLEQLESVLEHAESLLGQVKLPKDSRDGLLHAT